MAIALAQAGVGNFASSATSVSTPVMSAYTAGNKLIVFATLNNETRTLSMGPTTNISWSTVVGPYNHTDAGIVTRGYIFLGTVNTSGDTQVTATLSTSTNNLSIHCIEVSGLDTTPFDVSDTTSTLAMTSHALSTGVTPSVADSIVVTGARSDQNVAYTPATNYTEVSEQTRTSFQYRILSSSSLQTAAWTTSVNADCIHLAAVFKGAAVTGVPPSSRFCLLGVG